MSNQINRDDQVSLLDIAVVIAESWIVLVLVPLIAAILTFAALSALDEPEHLAQAVLALSDEDAMLVTSARVLDPAMSGSGWLAQYPGRPSEARKALADRLSVTPGSEPGTQTITLAADAPDRSRETLVAIIDSLVENSVPSEPERSQLELTLEALERALSELEATLERLNQLYDDTLSGELDGSTVDLGGLGNSIASLVIEIAAIEQEILAKRASLAGSVSPADVLEPPTASTSDNSRSHLLRAILVGLGVGFIVLVAAFIRAGLRSATWDPDARDKLSRIRKALWL